MLAVTLAIMDSLSEEKLVPGFVTSGQIWSLKSCTGATKHSWLCAVPFEKAAG